MRTDATIDKRYVRCPNTSHLGYDKWCAQVGDIINWTESGETRIGRMIGRVHYAPPCGEIPAIRDYILVVGMAQDLTHTFERWVNPVDVTRVQAIRNHAEILEWFLSDDMVRAEVGEVRRALEWGGSGLKPYRAWRTKLDWDIARMENK